MTDVPKPPDSEVNLAEVIRRRFAPLGGVDDLEPPPPVPVGEPLRFDFEPAEMTAAARSTNARRTARMCHEHRGKFGHTR